MTLTRTTINARIVAFIAVATVGLLAADVSHAQWLDPTLDNQRWNNLRKHQQRQRERAQERQRSNARPQRQACSLDSIPAANQRRSVAEYERRYRAEGRASADGWAAEQGRLHRQRLVAQGTCSARPKPISDRQLRPGSGP